MISAFPISYVVCFAVPACCLAVRRRKDAAQLNTVFAVNTAVSSFECICGTSVAGVVGIGELGGSTVAPPRRNNSGICDPKIYRKQNILKLLLRYRNNIFNAVDNNEGCSGFLSGKGECGFVNRIGCDGSGIPINVPSV